jgi:outer membrane protein assembly factor BamB
MLTPAQASDWNQQWPQWRGPLATGVSPTATPPIQWSETRNVKYKVEVPGSGTSTPIVWNDRIFLLTAIPTGNPIAAEPEPESSGESQRRPGGRPRGVKPDRVHQFVVLCLDRSTGTTLWQKVARAELPHEGHHPDHGYASASPVTDGKTLVAYFGSRGLHAFDLEGGVLWEKDFGQMQTRGTFGEGSSPALHGDTVLVLWEDEGDGDFLVALDKNSGNELWRTPRNEGTSWTTPLVVEHEGKSQVVIGATSAVRAYDLATGRELWAGPGLTANVIPAPVHANGVVYATSGFRGAALHAIKLGGSGDLAGGDAVLWSHTRNTPYVSSPLLVDGLLYFGSGTSAMLSCLDASDGKAHFAAERLEALNGIYASPVAAGDHVYVLGRNGTCLVLKKGPTLDIVATNSVDEKTDASIALVGSEVFIRGHKSLYCIAQN